MHSLHRLPLLIGCAGLACVGCATLPLPQRNPSPTEAAAPREPDTENIDLAVYERARAERAEYFEREVERLRADLRQAEASIVQLESGLRDAYSRADAVSAVAEARIALDRVSRAVPWRTELVAETRTKLDEAARQLAAGHVGAAMFFASRARRITDALNAEAQQVALWKERRSVRNERVNLRAGPSEEHRIVDVLHRETPVYPERTLDGWTLVRTPDGRVGWIFSGLLQ